MAELDGCDHTTVWHYHLEPLAPPKNETERATLAALYGQPGDSDVSTLVSRWLQAITCAGSGVTEAPPPTVEQTTGPVSATAQTTLTLPFPGATGPGRGVLVGVLSSDGTGFAAMTAADSKGNPYIRVLSRADSAGANSLAVWYCPKTTGSGATHSVTITAPAAADLTGVALEIRGVGAGLVVDSSASATGTSSTPACTGPPVGAVALISLALVALDATQASLAVSTTDGLSPAYTQDTEVLG